VIAYCRFDNLDVITTMSMDDGGDAVVNASSGGFT
jgi:hypothetical protein